jgi:hypothetical protein
MSLLSNLCIVDLSICYPSGTKCIYFHFSTLWILQERKAFSLISEHSKCCLFVSCQEPNVFTFRFILSGSCLFVTLQEPNAFSLILEHSKCCLYLLAVRNQLSTYSFIWGHFASCLSVKLISFEDILHIVYLLPVRNERHLVWF